MNKFRTISFLLLVTIIFCLLTPIFERKTISGPWNYTTKVDGYKNLEKNSLDVIGFGSSHMYCSLNPVVLKEKYDINAYVLATQQQPVKASYYYIKEALKTQKPKTIIFETFMINNSNDIIDDSIIYDAIDPLPLSINKLNLISKITKGKESKIPYYLTLFKYSSRWKDLKNEDFYYNPKTAQDEYNGYVYLTDSQSVPSNNTTYNPSLVEIDAEDQLYLNKIINLCNKEDIKLILLTAPFISDEGKQDINYSVNTFANQQDIDYIDGCELFDELKIDFNKDFYDFGHLNYYGSEKLTNYIANYLSK